MAEDRAPGPAGKPLVFRVDDSTPEVVQSVLLERGWDKFEQGGQDVEDWNLYWRASSVRMAKHANIKPWQRLNHPPGTTRLTRKDHLARHLRHMKTTYGAALDEFVPLTFVMPNDYSKFVAEYFRQKPGAGGARSCWICKPAERLREGHPPLQGHQRLRSSTTPTSCRNTSATLCSWAGTNATSASTRASLAFSL